MRSTEISDPHGNAVSLLDAIDPAHDIVYWLDEETADDIVLFTFPPQILNSPLIFVSEQLIGAILACDGLVVLRGRASEKSAWVAFERDYALRARKPVYNFDQASRTLIIVDPIEQPPLELPIYPHAMGGRENHQYVRNTMDSVLKFMRDQRYFDIYGHNLQNSWRGIESVLESGGYIVQFRAKTSQTYYETVDKIIGDKYPNRYKIIFALLEDCNVPDWLDPESESIIRLYHVDDPSQIDNRQIDYLIVRLYWLIFRNQFPELVYD